ncbi:50S ribosomal protein L10 [Acuticoccus sp. I52.16.1]|uniref:50S ribosomal protein L10 n=1 Tax=Acuticoccus sp. I52.16.1 TaxID=2928472 RepID=UPI00352E8B71
MNRSAGVSLSEHFEPGGAIRVAHVLETTVDRAEKREMVGFLEEVFADSGSVVVTQYIGLTVAEMTDLRRQMKDAGAKFKVIKNRLAKIALENGDRSVASEMFKGPVGIAYGIDPVAAPKVLTEYAKKNEKLKIIGGILGSSAMDDKGVEALAKMPPIEELRSKLMGVLLMPGSNLARVLNQPGEKLAKQLNAPAQNLIGVFAAYKAKLESAA